MNIIELAKEAGFWTEVQPVWVKHEQWIGTSEELERFAALVRAEALAEQEITTPDVCGEVCARAKLCYGCNKAFDEALSEPVKQEPVAYMHTLEGDVQINNLPAECYGDHWTRTPLYAAPVGADHFLKAIAALREGIATCRAEALEEAAKVCSEMQQDFDAEPYMCAAAIRGLK